MIVKRFDMHGSSHINGEYVSYSDCAKLESQLAALKEEITAVRQALDGYDNHAEPVAELVKAIRHRHDDYVESICELKEENERLKARVAELAAPAVQGEPVAEMSNDKMRDEFDSWIERQGVSTMKDGETYYHRVTHVAWQAWKASRAAPDIAVHGEPVAEEVLGYEQKPAPDVEALVEALERARDRIESERRSGEWDPLLRDIDAALAAHRKQGGRS